MCNKLISQWHSNNPSNEDNALTKILIEIFHPLDIRILL